MRDLDACASPRSQARTRPARAALVILLFVAPLVAASLVSLQQFRPAAPSSKSRCGRPAGTPRSSSGPRPGSSASRSRPSSRSTSIPASSSGCASRCPAGRSNCFGSIRSTGQAKRSSAACACSTERAGPSAPSIRSCWRCTPDRGHRVAPETGRARVVTTPGANDPMLLMRPSGWPRRRGGERAVRDAVRRWPGSRLAALRHRRRGFGVRRRDLAAGRSTTARRAVARGALPVAVWREAGAARSLSRCRCRSGISGTARRDALSSVRTAA